jgi:hypothetical protein
MRMAIPEEESFTRILAELDESSINFGDDHHSPQPNASPQVDSSSPLPVFNSASPEHVQSPFQTSASAQSNIHPSHQADGGMGDSQMEGDAESTMDATGIVSNLDITRISNHPFEVF